MKNFYKIFFKNKTTISQIKNTHSIRLTENIIKPPSSNILNRQEVEKTLTNLLHKEKSSQYQLIIESNKNSNPSDSLNILLDYPEGPLSNQNNTQYDIRVLIGEKESERGNEQLIAERIFKNLTLDHEYISTRGSDEKYLFNDVIRDGLAKDRGLFVPKYFPRFSQDQWARLINLNYEERCLRILESFPLGGLNPSDLKNMIYKAYSTFTDRSVIPLIKLNDRQYLMEEYYGPSASFKDLALQLFPHLFLESIKKFNGKIAVLVATSGDTGSAVLSGFEKIGIPVIVLYPQGKVSQIQEAQMVTAEGKVWVFGVKADFDFCQSAVKDIFNDRELTKYLKNDYNLSLTSANSINWGRLLPQVCYSINSYLDMVKVGFILTLIN